MWSLEAVADGFHQSVDQPLPRSSAVRSIACDVAVSNQLLQWRESVWVRAAGCGMLEVVLFPFLDTVLSKSLEPPLIGKWVQGLIEIVCKYK